MNTTAIKDQSAAILIKKSTVQTHYKMVVFPVVEIITLLTVGIFFATCGAASITAMDVVKAVIAKLFPFTGVTSTHLADTVVWGLRLPRIIMAIIAGAGFAVSGVAMQGIMRNPLVIPFTIGISSGAGFGASLAIVLGTGIAGSGQYIIIGNAFFFSVLSALLVYAIANLRGISPETLILGGILLTYLFSASTSLLQYIASENQLQGVVFWLFGSLSSATWNNVAVLSVVCAICIPILMKYSWDLNALATGDEVGASLGVNASRVRIAVMMLSSLITASIICFTGIIGFVCLVAPHITRMIIGSDHRILIPFASILGALLLLLADTVGRTILAPAEIPVGIVTAFIGVPMFLFLLLTKGSQNFK